MIARLAENLRRHVECLATVPRPPGSPEHAKAQAYLTRELEAAGFVVRRQEHHEDGFDWVNLLTEPLPADPTLPLFIVAAHYDSITHSPGADDNGSALAALVELARWIRPRLDGAGPYRARLQLVAYDLEEYGCVGSFAHARDLKAARTPVHGMISLEMLGYRDARPGSQQLPPHLAGLYPNTGDFIGVVGNEASAGLLQPVVAAMKTVPGLPVEYMAVPGDGGVVPETRLSDHSSFWDHGMPALMITDTSFFRNPHYHQASDTPETLDYEFLAKVTQGVCAAVWAMLCLEPQRGRPIAQGNASNALGTKRQQVLKPQRGEITHDGAPPTLTA